jgi:dTDP-4-amino-4,6-dideoxygalactose transaminase
MAAIMAIAERRGLAVVEDCAQAHLATSEGRPVGTIGTLGAFSFYPTKNLGALGDGGAIVTNDAALAARLRRLRNGGQSSRYHHVESGVNSRLDEMQAAILRARLPRLAGWTARRRAIAARYRAALADAPVTVLPERDPGHVYHLFTVHCADRDGLQAALSADGIGTLVHYPVPVHRQPAFADLPVAHCPVADAVASRVVSLPLHPALTDAEVDEVAASVLKFRPAPESAPAGR